MARPTRQQRRARRAEAADAGVGDGGAGERERSREARVPTAAAPSQAAERGAGGGSTRFVAESWAELKKVEWPGQSQVIQATTVVLIACVVVGIFLFAADYVFRNLVDNVFLRQ